MKRLMAEPERYGLDFAAIPNEPYFAVIDTGSQLQLTVAAQLAGTSYDELVALNPGYNRWATDPDGPHRMLVPIDNADAFEAALKTLAPEDRMRYDSHVVARRETLASIARQYGTSVAVLTKINDLPGGRVDARRDAEDSVDQRAAAGQGAARRLARRSPGDRLGRSQAAPDRLSGARGRDLEQHRAASWHAGEHARAAEQFGHRRPLIKGQRLVIKASARRYRDEGVKSGRRTLYTVRRGDTVYSISRQFQVSVVQLKSWNGLNKHHQIRAGQRLVMYIDSSHQQG